MSRSLRGLAASLVLLGLAATGASAAQDKVTICHAAGLDGTTHFVTLTIAYPAVYGPAGHFFENGTPRAGHEQDYLGPCQGDESPTATPIPSASPSQTPVVEPTPADGPTPEPRRDVPNTATADPADQDNPLLPLGLLAIAAGIGLAAHSLRRERR